MSFVSFLLCIKKDNPIGCCVTLPMHGASDFLLKKDVEQSVFPLLHRVTQFKKKWVQFKSSADKNI